MNENARMWMEISFNFLYMVFVWWLVAAMIRRRGQVAAEHRPIARLFIWAFALLGFGDLWHVGFRVWAYLLSDSLDSQVTFFDWQLGPVGMGALATAVTVTFFYVLVLYIWRARFNKPLGWFGGLLLLSAAVRLVIMTFPANEWNSSVPPQPWSLYRNLPLIILGLGTAYLILRDAANTGDTLFNWVGVCILISYAFYLPVIFFVQKFPLVGMLMIPKTVAYVAIGILAYQGLFKEKVGEIAPA